MIRKLKIYFYLGITSVLLFSCASLSTMQSGRTLGKDNVEISGNATVGSYSKIPLYPEDKYFDYKPIIGVRGQVGVTEKLDLGVNFDLNSFIGINIKRQFLGTQTSFFASSIGVGTGLNFGAFFLGDIKY